MISRTAFERSALACNPLAFWLRSLLAALLCAACAAPAGDPEGRTGATSDEVPAPLAAPPRLILQGRLAIPDPYDCTGGTTSTAMSWSACHKFKQHFDPATGAAITSNSYVPNARRPLLARVFVVYQAWPSGTICDQALTQTDVNGNFSVDVQNCSPDGQGVANFTVQLSADLQLNLGASSSVATMRALWAREKIPQAYFARDEDVVYTATDVNGVVTSFVVPTLAKNVFFTAPPAATTVALGDQLVDGFDFGPDYRDFVRGALSAYQNVVAIHARSRALLDQSGLDTDYARLFRTTAFDNCDNCYSLFFDLQGQFGGGFGGAATMTTAAPEAGISESEVMSLAAAGLIAHEFGHGINESLAPTSMPSDDSFHALSRNPDGSYDSHPHSPFIAVASDVLQQQEAGQAMVEGFAEAMARFLLLDGCNGNNPTFDALGSSNMLSNMWNPDNYAWCDGNAGSGCPFHNFRGHMLARGIAEGSAEWTRRKDALVALATTAASRGRARVFSNNEVKASQFFCKLLATRPDYSSMAGRVRNQWYVNDYSYLASEILDGRTPTVTWRRYASDVSATGAAHVTLRELMQAMSQVCPDCYSDHSPLPLALWQLPQLTDGANATYDATRISIYGMLSPQNLARILISSGRVTRSKMNNLLRASFMEEIE